MTAPKHNKTQRTNIPEDLVAKMLVESRNTCNVCWKSKETQIHHMTPVEQGGDNGEDNLIVLCLNCHSVAHSRKAMARNLSPRTLRLYKETWLDYVRRHPLCEEGAIHEEHDLKTIRDILKQGHRRALYFPFSLEVPRQMFRSLNTFRVFLQSSGYRLLKNDEARNHIHEIFKALVEISFFEPRGGPSEYCLYGHLGVDAVSLLEIRRRTACFHLNELARLVGCPEDMIDDSEFDWEALQRMRLDSETRHCFGEFCPKRDECQRCEVKAECVEATPKFH